MQQNFDHIRPYNDSEAPAAIQRIVSNPYFPLISQYLFPNRPVEEIRQLCLSAQNIDDFQVKVMWPVMENIILKTTEGVSNEGFDLLDKNINSMYICNHRDILLDAAIADLLLYKNGQGCFEITFGSNLMKGEIVIDIGKINRMFRIMRGGNIRDFYKNSLEVSAYMRHVILDKKRSVWIAQRNGRTKDGDDQTEMAVLKMFSLSSSKPFAENLGELNITPIAVSYEYEPCDFLKTQELYVSRYQQYIKSPDEDLHSILKGIMQPKGHVHFVVTPAIRSDELAYCDRFEKNHKFQKLAEMIDRRIYANYKLWKTNYIAYDLRYQSYKYKEHYTSSEKQEFVDYMENGLQGIMGEMDELRDIFLGIYANPVKNFENMYV